jgi:chorismate synthase
MTILEILIGVIAIALVVGLFVLARLATRVGQAADEVGLAARRVAEITPAARMFMEAGHAELEALRTLTGTMSAIAENAETVTGHASAITSRLMQGVGSSIFDRYRAVFAGLRAGAGVLGWVRSRNGSRRFEHPRLEAHTRAEAFDDLND